MGSARKCKFIERTRRAQENQWFRCTRKKVTKKSGGSSTSMKSGSRAGKTKSSPRQLQ